MIDVVDYGGGNVGSVARCLSRLGADFRMAGSGAELAASANPVLLPGVGSFGAVMRALESRGLAGAIPRAVASGRHFLGICVGLQVLFEGSEESPGVPGLGLLEGSVTRFRKGKVPQIGWNRVVPVGGGGWQEGFAYFVNSYAAEPADGSATLYEADYHGPFCAAVSRGRVLAFQFHPEKSGPFGQGLIRRWLGAVQAHNTVP